MKFKYYFILCFIIIFWTHELNADSKTLSINDFAHGFYLELEGISPIYELIIPKDIYEKIVNPDLRDLRVFNKQGQIVPHTIQRPVTEQKIEKKDIILPFFPLTKEQESKPLSIKIITDPDGSMVKLSGNGITKENIEQKNPSAYLIDVSSLDNMPNSLDISWNEGKNGFITSVYINGSNNLTNWNKIANDVSLADLDYGGNRLIRQTIYLNSNCPKVKYLYMPWSIGKKGYQLKQVKGVFMSSISEPNYQWLKINAAKKTNEPFSCYFESTGFFPVDIIKVIFSENNTAIQAEISSKQKSEDINWNIQFRGMLYNLKIDNSLLTNEPIILNHTTYHRNWRLNTAQNNLDFASILPYLEIGWIPHKILFIAKGYGPFILAFGSSKAKPYDTQLDPLLHNLYQKTDNIKLLKKAKALNLITLGGNDALKKVTAPIQFKQIILWIILIFAVIILGFMAWRLYSQMDINKST